MAKFEATWTGSWPCLCSGEWALLKNGVDVSDSIPESKRYTHMETEGSYEECHLDEESTYYDDGLEVEDWIAENPWIDSICDTEDEKRELFYEFSVSDWRHSSCGGCCI